MTSSLPRPPWYLTTIHVGLHTDKIAPCFRPICIHHLPHHFESSVTLRAVYVDKVESFSSKPGFESQGSGMSPHARDHPKRQAVASKHLPRAHDCGVRPCQVRSAKLRPVLHAQIITTGQPLQHRMPDSQGTTAHGRCSPSLRPSTAMFIMHPLANGARLVPFYQWHLIRRIQGSRIAVWLLRCR